MELPNKVNELSPDELIEMFSSSIKKHTGNDGTTYINDAAIECLAVMAKCLQEQNPCGYLDSTGGNFIYYHSDHGRRIKKHIEEVGYDNADYVNLYFGPYTVSRPLQEEDSKITPELLSNLSEEISDALEKETPESLNAFVESNKSQTTEVDWSGPDTNELMSASEMSLKSIWGRKEEIPSLSLLQDMVREMEKEIGSYSTPLTRSIAERCAAIASKHSEQTAKALLKWCWDNRVIYNNVDENTFRIHGTGKIFTYEEIYSRFIPSTKHT